MMKEESMGWARMCDTCRSAACAVYCRADSAYLCAGCDARVHAANRVASRHERVRVCGACERAPAAFICKADAASLCASCDAEIHSANPLARRHHRIPILPISAAGPPEVEDDEDEEEDEDDDDEAASWLLLNPNRPAAAGININQGSSNNNNNGFLFGGGEVDEYLDLVEYNSGGGNEKMMTSQTSVMLSGGGGGDSVVPCGGDGHENMNMMMMVMESNKNNNNNNNNNLQSSGFFQLGLDFDDHSPPKPSYSIFNDTISQSVSVSSLDVSVVPDSTMSDMSMISHLRPPKGTIDLFNGPPIQAGPTQLSPLDREARVLRYREKKKNRKFEKTIRYASRKAYAETRPRIKGRFAKRTDVDLEVDHMFSMADTGYGIVPSF